MGGGEVGVIKDGGQGGLGGGNVFFGDLVTVADCYFGVAVYFLAFADHLGEVFVVAFYFLVLDGLVNTY